MSMFIKRKQAPTLHVMYLIDAKTHKRLSEREEYGELDEQMAAVARGESVDMVMMVIQDDELAQRLESPAPFDDRELSELHVHYKLWVPREYRVLRDNIVTLHISIGKVEEHCTAERPLTGKGLEHLAGLVNDLRRPDPLSMIADLAGIQRPYRGNPHMN